MQCDDLRRTAEAHALTPEPDSLFLRDQLGWKTAPHRCGAHQRRLWLDSRQLTRILLTNMIDHLSAAVRLLDGPGIFLWAQSSVTRVACEAAVKIAYLLDPSISYDLRITRAAGLLIHSADEKVKAASRVTVVVFDAEDRARSEKNALLDRVRRAGIGASAGSAKPLTSPSGQEVQRNPRVTELMDRYYPERPALYQQTSAVVHSTVWTLISAIASAPSTPELILQPDLLEIGATTLAAIDAACLASTMISEYYGCDPQPASARSRRRATAIDDLMKNV